MILSMVEMVILVVAVLIAGAICGIVLYYLQNHNKQKNAFVFADFSGSSTYSKMLNSDVAVDEIISDFKLLD